MGVGNSRVRFPHNVALLNCLVLNGVIPRPHPSQLIASGWIPQVSDRDFRGIGNATWQSHEADHEVP